MTEQRRVVAPVLSDSADHPDVEQLYQRASEFDLHIWIATVYRTVHDHQHFTPIRQQPG